MLTQTGQRIDSYSVLMSALNRPADTNDAWRAPGCFVVIMSYRHKPSSICFDPQLRARK